MKILKTINLLTCLFCFTITFSQDLSNNNKLWYGANVNYKLNNDFKVKFGSLYAQNTNPSDFSFAQFKLGLAYRIKKNLYANLSYEKQLLNDSRRKRELYNITPGLFNKLEFDQVNISTSYKHDLVKRLSLDHEIEYEHFLIGVEKHKSRINYTAKLAYNIRKSSITPFLENQLYYYSGGDISNGVKRYRLKAGASIKPIKDFAMTATIYHLIQNEFSTDQLPENDYGAFGINLNFNIN